MLTSVYSHVFLTAAGFDTKALPPIDDHPRPAPKRRRKSLFVWEKKVPMLRETREQCEAPTPDSRLDQARTGKVCLGKSASQI